MTVPFSFKWFFEVLVFGIAYDDHHRRWIIIMVTSKIVIVIWTHTLVDLLGGGVDLRLWLILYLSASFSYPISVRCLYLSLSFSLPPSLSSFPSLLFRFPLSHSQSPLFFLSLPLSFFFFFSFNFCHPISIPVASRSPFISLLLSSLPFTFHLMPSHLSLPLLLSISLSLSPFTLSPTFPRFYASLLNKLSD